MRIVLRGLVFAYGLLPCTEDRKDNKPVMMNKDQKGRGER